MNDNLKLDIAYIAGLFDGEGTVSYKKYPKKRKGVKKDYTTWNIGLEISMTDKNIIELVHEITNINKNIKIRYDMILDNDFETKETLKECIDLILHLPKPVLFNLFSLKHFPGYPLTKKAIEAGHVTEEEVGDWPEQIKSTTENWKFKPRWIKRKKTRTKQLQRLNNIIWLMCWNRASDRVVKYGVFGKSVG